MTTTCCKCIVSGRVQGVFFRASAQQYAQGLGLSGYAMNLPDGRVEVVACGTPEAVNEMREWLWTGPEWARVTDVACKTQDASGFDRFSIR